MSVAKVYENVVVSDAEFCTLTVRVVVSTLLSLIRNLCSTF